MKVVRNFAPDKEEDKDDLVVEIVDCSRRPCRRRGMHTYNDVPFITVGNSALETNILSAVSKKIP